LTSTLELKKHREKLSPEKTDEVVKAVADMIVNYLNGNRKGHQERDDEHPED